MEDGKELNLDDETCKRRNGIINLSICGKISN